MIFNSSNLIRINGPSVYTSSGRYLIFNKKASELLGLNETTKISFKIEDDEILLYHDNKEGVIPEETQRGNYRIHSKKMISFLQLKLGDNKPTFAVVQLQKDTFELKLKPKPEL